MQLLSGIKNCKQKTLRLKNTATFLVKNNVCLPLILQTHRRTSAEVITVSLALRINPLHPANAYQTYVTCL